MTAWGTAIRWSGARITIACIVIITLIISSDNKWKDDDGKDLRRLEVRVFVLHVDEGGAVGERHARASVLLPLAVRLLNKPRQNLHAQHFHHQLMARPPIVGRWARPSEPTPRVGGCVTLTG